MAYLSFNDLSEKTLFESHVINKRFSENSYGMVKVFLSYRRVDKGWIVDIVNFLKNIGVNVYIDYIDETLEDKTNEHVATLLRKSISQCSKFITLATPNSTSSKWMPWELGLGDRIVNYKNVAILPVTNRNNDWGDQEYGKIYGKLENSNPYRKLDPESWQITYPTNEKIKFKDWIKLPYGI